jgi:hypothetical protein
MLEPYLQSSNNTTVNMMSSDESVKAFISDPVLQKRLAKYLALKCFEIQYWRTGMQAHRQIQNVATTLMLL